MKYAIAAFAALAAAPAFAQDSPKALQDAFAAAVVAENADALAALYTDAAASYGPDGSVMEGRDAIAASWKGFFDAFDGFSITLDQKGEHAASKKSHAAWGLWTMSAKPKAGGAPVTWNGRFLDVSVNEGQGWRYIADHASMLAPPIETAEKPATE